MTTGPGISSIDFDEVTIERVVHRDGSNEYLLNGTQVRLKDIVEQLAGAHIGATGHHIISQGEADRILTASICERREMIEDALSLKTYQWKKLESIRKLDRTTENVKQVESLRREIAPHIKFLKKQVEKIEKVEEMRLELVRMYKEYFFHEQKYLRQEKSRLENEISRPKQELTELDRGLEEAKKILTLSQNRDKKSDQIIKLENKLASVRHDKDNIMRELGRLEGEIHVNRRAIQKEQDRKHNDEFKTVYLKDIESVADSIESFRSIEDAKKLFSEVVSLIRNFIAKHRTSSDSETIAEAEHEIKKLLVEKDNLDAKLKSIGEKEVKCTNEYDDLKRAVEKEKDTNRDAEKDVFRIIARQNEVRSVVSRITELLNQLSNEEENFKRELGEAGIVAGREAVAYDDAVISGSEILDVSRADQAERRRQIEKIKVRLEDAGAGGGTEVMKEYKETEERDAFLARELEDLEKAKGELNALIAELDVRIDQEFKTGILKINTQFQHFFELMFGGGKAELSVIREMKRRKKSDLEDLGVILEGNGDENTSYEDALETDGPEGLEVNVNLPRKKIKGLMMLSGGERALTSIALLFAISQVNPPPFIILDETDAALDEANSKKYADMIENLSVHSQLILITHNRETMSRAGVLYGVTMGSDGASRLLSVAFEEAVKIAK